MKKVLFAILLMFTSPLLGQVKKIGTPFIQNFEKEIYKAGTQNWGISQDKQGFMYFANNDGLLRYDGVKWELSKISDSSPLRSVFVDEDNTIYVGLINDFGLLRQDENKQAVFESLKHLLPEDCTEFDDVWRIHKIDGGIVFQSFKYLFILNKGQIKVHYPQKLFHFSFQLGGTLYVQEPGIGFFEFKNQKLNQLPVSYELVDKNITSVLMTDDDNVLIGTESHGLYLFDYKNVRRWDVPVNDLVIQNRLYTASKLPGGYFAFGTILDGLLITNGEGTIVQKLNTQKNIQNNTVLSSYVDLSGNLWLGLDNGIDYVEINSPLSFFRSKNLGAGYTCRVYDKKLYMGTNQGLYVKSLNGKSTDEFSLVKGTEGQVWSLDEFNGELICGHNRGTFRIKGNESEKIGEQTGTWKYIELKNKPDLLLGGHYQGLVKLKWQNNKWQYHWKLKGFDESSRYLVEGADESIWVGHGGKGIYRLRLNERADSVTELMHFTSESGLPSNTGNILFAYRSGIFAATDVGIFEFQESTNTFVISESMNSVFEGCGRIKTLVADDSNDIWFISDNESGVIRSNEDMTFTKITSPLKKLQNKFVNEFEFIYPLDNENIYLGLEDGFAHYSALIPKFYDSEFRSFITKVELPYLDSLIFNRIDTGNQNYEFPFRKNTFRFHFASPFFENEEPLEFSYYLNGFSEEWSTWQNDSYKDFTTLKEGEYTFQVKARNIFGIESETASFSFEILPPWHRSRQALFVYALILLLLAFALTKYVLFRVKRSKQRERLRHEQEIRKQEEYHQREALIAEKQIIKLRNDKLRAEMIHRDKELANQTMGIIHKNKFLIRVNDDLNAIQDFVVNSTAKGKIYNLKKRIKKEIDIKQQSQIFETYFDEVHEEFFKKLKEKFPILTPNDLRICAFIRMNLTTQEIAAILNISYRGAEISRYRLRKKLELERSTNLSTFLSNI